MEDALGEKEAGQLGGVSQTTVKSSPKATVLEYAIHSPILLLNFRHIVIITFSIASLTLLTLGWDRELA